MAITAEFRGLTKVFGNRKALDRVNLQIHEDEILALLGPNGSGKTTLLKILAFIENPTSGEVKFQGERVSFKSTEKMRLQSTLVFQKTTLFDTSVYNNIAYGLRIRKTPHDVCNEEIRKVLRLVKLEGFEKRPARKLSGGEQQRVAIARALTLKTKLLLLDEPTANLDPKNAQIVEEAIATVNREQKITIVMATHNMFQAKTLPQRIALMSNGGITEVGAPAEIFGKLSKNLASFAAVENTYPGTAAAAENGTVLVDVGNGLLIEASIRKRGKVTVFVSPQDIVLSKARLESSARNCFKGRIVEISESGFLVRLKVDVGRTFIAQITKRSFSEMGLNLNSEVFLTFKASSVQTI